MKLAEIQKEYEEIYHSALSDHCKAIKYANLMTVMEGIYKVPMLKNEEWEKENKTVIAMYRKLSRSRTFD
ncbi:hypothetical protein [Halalkalibacter alkalisediminis]|uniref:Transposase n=1 Tax=Halalkalibacter alkalisediminis TaxID=935616 RepID=A0ABV6NL12_9BACI